MRPPPIVHLELHTGDVRGAVAFYSQLCGWQPEHLEAAGKSYLSLGVGGSIGGGVVGCTTDRPVWLPYVEVESVDCATDRAAELGGAVLLAPREGPAGWRSVVRAPAGGGEIAFWQPKR